MMTIVRFKNFKQRIMNIRELRIGNWVNCITNIGIKVGKICMLQDIMISADVLDGKDYSKYYNYIDKIQEGVSNFYWDLYNREDNGAIGRGVNDASLGRYYEQILKDIIHYQYVFSHDTI